MKRAQHFAGLTALATLLIAVPAFAQMAQPAGDAAMVVWVDPLPGHGSAFEEGVRQHMSNMMEAGETQTWVSFEVIAGDRTGQYVVGTFNHAWADFDQPPPNPAMAGESMADNIVPHVEDFEIQYIWRDTNLGTWAPDEPIAPMYQLIQFDVKPGHMPGFETFVSKIKNAFETMGEGSYSVFRPVLGGQGGQVTISVPRQGFAEFAQDDPQFFENMMRELYGVAETRLLMETMDAAIASERSYLLVFRPDMSMNLPDS
ncbi:MAG: hypothetical protein R3195_10175 [Gemmatimonadota bacterium]|nr:hypothetical protein [Gemmatimonadota bacterium]